VPYADFVDPQSLNLYSYVRNNPLSRFDPDGHELIKLGQHTDDEINARTKEINNQLKDKSLSADARSALKAEKTTLGLEKQGNAVIGNLLSKLDQTGQRNGLQLSNFTLSTDTKNDFASATNPEGLKQLTNDQAFVIQNKSKYGGTIYVRTEPENGFYQQSRRSSDFGYFGASAISHEQIHPNGGGEYPAYQRQLGVFEGFHNYFQNQQLYQTLDDLIRGGIDANKPH
jgi:hypothetical protein